MTTDSRYDALPDRRARRTRTRATRRIAADPTSTALLLAGPTALEMWPGVRRVGDAGGRALVELVPDSPPAGPVRLTAAAVRALPPQRTPTSFVTRFEWSGPGLPGTRGELVLSYLPGGDGTPATAATLVLDSEDVEASALGAGELAAMSDAFLANLAAAAERRSSAA